MRFTLYTWTEVLLIGNIQSFFRSCDIISAWDSLIRIHRESWNLDEDEDDDDAPRVSLDHQTHSASENFHSATGRQLLM